MFAPIGCHVKENEIKCRNLKIEIFGEKKRSGDMVEWQLSTKFGLDPCMHPFMRNLSYGRRTPAPRSSADKVKQS